MKHPLPDFSKAIERRIPAWLGVILTCFVLFIAVRAAGALFNWLLGV